MAYSPQNPPLPWPLMAFLADAISGECSDKQAQPTSSATLNCSAAWPPGHSWPHLARSYLQENGVGITVVSAGTGMTGGPAKIIAGAGGCMDLFLNPTAADSGSRYIPYRTDNGTWLNAAEDQPWL
jgi:hypothetical protein